MDNITVEQHKVWAALGDKWLPDYNNRDNSQFRRAIIREVINYELLKKILTVTFTKADGTLRTMRCTLIESLVPVGSVKTPKPIAIVTDEFGNRLSDPDKKPPETRTVFDLDANAWRSFRYDLLISIGFNESTK